MSSGQKQGFWLYKPYNQIILGVVMSSGFLAIM